MSECVRVFVVHPVVLAAVEFCHVAQRKLLMFEKRKNTLHEIVAPASTRRKEKSYNLFLPTSLSPFRKPENMQRDSTIAWTQNGEL